MQLAPWSTVGMLMGTDIAQPHPAPIGTGGLRAEMRRRVHLARAATRGDDAGWWGAGRLWVRHSGLRTGLAVGLVGEARKGLRDPRALAGWRYALGWPRDACGVTPGPGSMPHAAQPEQTQQHQLVEKEVGYHRVAPFHGGETRALYPFCRLLHYPHDRGTRPLTLIFDKGNNSKDNFGLIDTLKLHYVGSIKLSEVKELAEISNQNGPWTSCQTLGLEKTRCFRVMHDIYGKARTVMVTYNANLFQTQYLTLQNDIAKAITELHKLSQKLQDRAQGLIKGGQCPTVASITKQCKAILSRPYMKSIMTYTVQKDSHDIPQLDYNIAQDVINQLSDTYLGKNIIITDRAKWHDEQIILAYRSQFHIENVFKDMKDRDIGSWWPLYHWTDQKINVHSFYCTIAVLLRALAHRRVKQAGIDISMKRLLAELDEIKEVIVLYPKKRGAKTSPQHTVLSKTSELQQSLLSILDVKPEEIAPLG